jgi:hypothetical protein
MTMYLPNDHVRPTGAELAEFIDAPPVGNDRVPRSGPAEPPDDQYDATAGVAPADE